MKTRLSKAVLTLLIIAMNGAALCADQPAQTGAAATTSSVGPRIKFDALNYEFGRVRAGTLVKHDFVFTNIGDATLEITGVMPGCHCTTVGDWTHKVEPGQTGVIPIQFDSSGFGGSVYRTPSITCNDQSQALVRFQLHGTVVKPIDINPTYVSMVIGPDSSDQTNGVVHIVNNEDEPLVLQLPTSSQKTFTAELRTNTPGKDFDLIIRTVPPLPPGNNQALITVGTDTADVKPISVFALAMVQPLVVLTPPQIALPTGPLTNNQTFSIFVRNQSTRPLLLSEPTVNAKGATATVQVSQAPGKIYTASVELPAGFQAPPGEPLELTIKTDNKRFPVIKVPIKQVLPPAAVAPKPVRMVQ